MDSPEKIQEARLIRARMDDAINSLKNQQARHINVNASHRSDVLADFLVDRRQDEMPAILDDRFDHTRQVKEKALDAMQEQSDRQKMINERASAEQKRLQEQARQAIKHSEDRPRPVAEPEVRPVRPPTATPERRMVEPVLNDSKSDADSSESDGERN